jgi:hypothetical protein
VSGFDANRQKLEIRDGPAGFFMEIVELTDEGTIFRCALKKGLFHGAIDANTYLVGPPSTFFAELASDWRGWNGRKTWEDRDHALSLKASNRGGPVVLEIKLRFDRPPEFTSLASSLMLESASLDRIAKDSAELFREDRALEFIKKLRK